MGVKNCGRNKCANARGNYATRRRENQPVECTRGRRSGRQMAQHVPRHAAIVRKCNKFTPTHCQIGAGSATTGHTLELSQPAAPCAKCRLLHDVGHKSARPSSFIIVVLRRVARTYGNKPAMLQNKLVGPLEPKRRKHRGRPRERKREREKDKEREAKKDKEKLQHTKNEKLVGCRGNWRRKEILYPRQFAHVLDRGYIATPDPSKIELGCQNAIFMTTGGDLKQPLLANKHRNRCRLQYALSNSLEFA